MDVDFCLPLLGCKDRRFSLLLGDGDIAMNCVDLEEGEQKAPAMFSKSF